MKQHKVSDKCRDNRKNAMRCREEEFHRKPVDICSTCGFDKNAMRGVVVLDCNPLSVIKAEENTCSECGHQKDGSTIGKSIAIKGGGEVDVSGDE